jgi:hypothetical protein
MIRYLESIIKCSVNLAADDLNDQRQNPAPPSAKDTESDSSFITSLLSDANAIASKRQIHATSHTRTCFKYSNNRTHECRFLFPRDLIAQSHVNGHGVVHLERNHQWINPWNPVLASLLRSNHDISFIPTAARALAAVYYMTNYATKYDVSQYQLIMTAAIVKEGMEDAASAPDPSDEQQWLRRLGMDKFALRAFNRLSGDREVSGPQAAAYILNQPDYYTLPTQIRRLNVQQLRSRFKYIAGLEPGSFQTENELLMLNASNNMPFNMLDHYRWRGTSLFAFCLYEYIKLVTIKPRSSAASQDIEFATAHPNYSTHVQHYSERASVHRYMVTLIGSLSENQSLEDSVRGGHPQTSAIQNDLAEIFLALLLPWERLPSLFATFQLSSDSYKDHCHSIWSNVKSSLPLHLQDVAKNIELLRKSKEDARVDTILRNNARQSALYQEAGDLNSDNEDEIQTDDLLDIETPSNVFLDLDTLHQAYLILKQRWRLSDLQSVKDIPFLSCNITRIMDEDIIHGQQLPSQPIQPDDIHIPKASSQFCHFAPEVLDLWQDKIKINASGQVPHDIDDENNFDDLDNDTLSSGVDAALSNTLIPIIDFIEEENDPTILQQIERLGPNPTGLAVTQVIQDTLPLYYKQALLVRSVLDHAIQLAGNPTVEAGNQLLLYTAGEGGTGKSRVIKAIELGYTLLRRKQEVVLMAPTGTAAHNIGGRTIHTALGIDINDLPRTNLGSYIPALWRDKTIMIIDEISMVSLTMLTTINQQCNRIHAIQQDSTAIFGGLPIVIFLGDFCQFPPVRGFAFWQSPRSPQDSLGQLLWHRFTNVIFLDEQMRQQGDLEFQAFLHRVRTNSVTEADITDLNTRVAQHLSSNNGIDSLCITRMNQRRHIINRSQIRDFAESRNQDVYVFPANHKRTHGRKHNLPIDHILGTQDGEGSAKGPGLLFYTAGMPVAMLYNSCTPLGLVNGAKGIAAGIIPHIESKFT